MKFSRGEFFKMLGGGAAVAATLPKALATAPGNTEARETLDEHIKGKDGERRFSAYDVIPDILYSRFDPIDFNDRSRVSLFSRGLMDYPRGIIDTNMHMGGMLCAPEMFAVGTIQIITDRTTSEQELHEFERNMEGVLWIGNKIYARPLMSRVLTSAALDDLVVRHANSFITKPGKMISSKAFRMNPPVLITTLFSFHFELGAVSGWRFNDVKTYKPTFGGYVLLDGHRARGIQ